MASAPWARYLDDLDDFPARAGYNKVVMCVSGANRTGFGVRVYRAALKRRKRYV